MEKQINPNKFLLTFSIKEEAMSNAKHLSATQRDIPFSVSQYGEELYFLEVDIEDKREIARFLNGKQIEELKSVTTK